MFCLVLQLHFKYWRQTQKQWSMVRRSFTFCVANDGKNAVYSKRKGGCRWWTCRTNKNKRNKEFLHRSENEGAFIQISAINLWWIPVSLFCIVQDYKEFWKNVAAAFVQEVLQLSRNHHDTFGLSATHGSWWSRKSRFIFETIRLFDHTCLTLVLIW